MKSKKQYDMVFASDKNSQPDRKIYHNVSYQKLGGRYGSLYCVHVRTISDNLINIRDCKIIDHAVVLTKNEMKSYFKEDQVDIEKLLVLFTYPGTKRNIVR